MRPSLSAVGEAKPSVVTRDLVRVRVRGKGRGGGKGRVRVRVRVRWRRAS